MTRLAAEFRRHRYLFLPKLLTWGEARPLPKARRTPGHDN